MHTPFILGFCTFFVLISSNIVTENEKLGNNFWWSVQGENDLGPPGFTTRMSYDPGDIVHFKISAEEAYTLWIFRLGYYGGRGAKLYGHINVSSQNEAQPVCLFENSTRMTDCSNWKISAGWVVPQEATSGLYVAFAETQSGFKGNYIPFIVRKIDGGSDLLFKVADLTWVAYNKYGGWNLYRGNGSFTFDSRAKKASYNRPFSNRLPRLMGGQHQNFFLGSEFPMLYWLERHGFDVSYAACADVEQLGQQNNIVGRYKVLLSVGHDEYWTPGLRLAFETAREGGVHLAFFSGNEVFWRVRWHKHEILDTAPNSSIFRGAHDTELRGEHNIWSNRIMICYKETIEGNAIFSSDEWTGTFVDPRFRAAEPPNALTGQYFLVNGFRGDSMEVPKEYAKLRFWRNTEIALLEKTSGKYVSGAGLLGYEWDVFVDDCSRPVGLFSLSSTVVRVEEKLMESYGASYRGTGMANHRLTMYRHVSRRSERVSSLVFSAGTIQWSWALCGWHDGDNMEEDFNLQQATINVLADMNVFPANLNESAASPALVLSTSSSDAQPPSSIILSPKSGQRIAVSKHGFIRVSGQAWDNGGGVVAAVEVSLDGGKTWGLAEGRETWTYRHLMANPKSYCFDATNSEHESEERGRSQVYNILSRAVDDSGWIEGYGLSSSHLMNENATNFVHINVESMEKSHRPKRGKMRDNTSSADEKDVEILR